MTRRMSFVLAYSGGFPVTEGVKVYLAQAVVLESVCDLVSLASEASGKMSHRSFAECVSCLGAYNFSEKKQSSRK